jgi:phosphohistidine phosphatase
VKTVFLLRHAKSSWDEPFLDDYERPLALRGRKAAPRMGEYMAQEGLVPDRVLCSGARRARETWELVSEALGSLPPTQFLSDIYHGSAGTLLDLIHHLPDNEESVLLVGHNPTFQDFALLLAGSGEEEPLRQMTSKYPTGALAILDFQGERWTGVLGGAGYLRAFVRPKAL